MFHQLTSTLLIAFYLINVHTLLSSDNNRRMTMLQDAGRSRRKVINSNDLANVLKKDTNIKTQSPISKLEVNYYDDDDEEIDESSSSFPNAPVSSYTPPTTSNNDEEQAEAVRVPSSSSGGYNNDNSNNNDNDNEDSLFGDDESLNLSNPLDKVHTLTNLTYPFHDTLSPLSYLLYT